MCTARRTLWWLLAACFLGPSPASWASPEKNSMSHVRKHLEWNFVRAESEYQLSPKDLQKKYNLIFASEELANYVCLKDLPKKLDFAGKPDDPECLSLLEELKKLDPESPAVLCAEEGFSSESCEKAYLRQLPITRRRAGLRTVQNSIDYKEREKLEELKKAHEADRSLESRQALLKAYRPKLGKACSGTTLKLIAREEYHETVAHVGRKGNNQDLLSLVERMGSRKKKKRAFPKTEDSHIQDDDSPTAKILAELKDTETKTPARVIPDEGMVRLRALPHLCDELIQDILQIEPLSSLAVCYRDGFYSTFCIQTRKNETNYLQNFGHQDDLKSSPKRPRSFSEF